MRRLRDDDSHATTVYDNYCDGVKRVGGAPTQGEDVDKRQEIGVREAVIRKAIPKQDASVVDKDRPGAMYESTFTRDIRRAVSRTVVGYLRPGEPSPSKPNAGIAAKDKSE